MEYYITDDIHLAAALMTNDQEMTYSRDGKKVYFYFPQSAILRTLVEKYRDDTLFNGMLRRHDEAIHVINKIIKGKI